ncbi:PadR family transcriptional regulator [Paenibacillus zeisoli]|uniref:PadR family transcriptional regulator n=1 Tax=Paenibacillus zeisoli TaxID=2496267 RepID=A0A3S1D8M0_9BACL|nr:PadR family transcriptional regulator [Paenibacillus zeisoli]RUT29885.1 PadR family transcriptional regulator [Paenibacillus zeisoli]
MENSDYMPSGSGKNERKKRFFGRGGVKYALLELLTHGPKHGYQMIKALEEESGGIYAPSPGSIYPTLNMLETRKLISSEAVEGKKVYSLTESGRQFLNDMPIQELYGASAYRKELYRIEREGHGKGFKDELSELLLLIGKAEKATVGHPFHWERFRSALDELKVQMNTIVDDLDRSRAITPKKKDTL